MSALSRLQNAMKEGLVEAILVSSELNCRYLSELVFSDGYLMITQDRAFLLTDPRYSEIARATVKEFEIVVPNGRRDEAIADIARTLGIGELAAEGESMSHSEFLRLSELLPCKLTSGASSLISALRRVKTPAELEKIAAAQRITDKAFEHILGFITPEVTERDVALELEFFMRREGAESVAFDTIAVSGAASSLPHGVPSDVKLRRGFLTMDFGARLDGYCSDMTRTVCIGHADEEMKKVYNTVLSAQLRALEHIAEGMLCRDADALARDLIAGAGYGDAFGHSLGHGVGLYIHESPSLSRLAPENSRLCRGNVVTVEPGIYLEGRFGVRIEDMIAIDHDGSVRNFTRSPKQLIEL